jgi:hypothetical protein
MVFDLSNTSFIIYFDGNLYEGPGAYTLTLQSRYSNETILNGATIDGGPYFDLNILTSNDRFTQAEVDFSDTDLQTLEVEGYYKWIVSLDGTAIATGLAKVINSSEEIGQTRLVEYQSNNDPNETIVYFQ